MSSLVTLTKTDKLTMVGKCLHVNGNPFRVAYPSEQFYGIEDNKIITLFRGHLYNYWERDDVQGYYL